MKPTGATKEATRLTELYVASESRVKEGDATIRMRAGDVWVGQVKRKHAAEIVTAVNERERLRATQTELIAVLKEAMKVVSDRGAGGRMLTTVAEASDIWGRCAKAILDAQNATLGTSAGGE